MRLADMQSSRGLIDKAIEVRGKEFFFAIFFVGFSIFSQIKNKLTHLTVGSVLAIF